MRTPLLILSTALLCSAAIPEESPAQITIGALTHRVEPPGNGIAGYKPVDFTTRLTNTSKEPIWFYAQRRTSPFYVTLSRPTPKSQWTIQLEPECSLGAQFHKLEPGAFISFDAFVHDHPGHEFRVEMDIYRSPDKKAKPFKVSSEAIVIK